MAEQQEQVIFDLQINVGDTAKRLADVTAELAKQKEERKRLTKEIQAGNDADGENSRQLTAVNKEITALTAKEKALTGQLQTTYQTNEQLGDSFREMDAVLRQLENEYKSLSKSQRESAEGQALKDAIIKQKQALKDFDAELGNYQRNVGNYTNSILDAFGKLPPSMQGAVNPIKSVTAGFKAMSQTPVIAIIGLLINLITKLSEKFKQNGAAMESLTSVFGVFEGVGQLVNKLIDKLAEGVVWLADKLLSLADKLGLINETMKESQRIAQDELALQGQQRKVARQNAEDMQEIANLRAKANEKDKVGTQERIRLLQQAADKEEEIARRNKEAAEAAYNLQVAKNAQSNSSQKDLQKENDLYIQMINAQTQYLQKQRELNGQMAQERQKQADEARKVAAVRLEIERALQDALVELDADETSKRVQQLKIAGEREVENLRIKMQQLKQTDLKAREELSQLIIAREKQTQKEIDNLLIQSVEQREQAMRQNAYNEMTMGLNDTLMLGQMRLQYMQEQYNHLQSLDDNHKAALYKTEEAYNAALLAAEANMLQARESLIVENYNREQLERQNNYQRKLQGIQTDAVAVAQAEYTQAAEEQRRLLSLDQATKDALYDNEEAYTAAVIAMENRVTDAKKKAMDEERKRAAANATAIANSLGSMSDLLAEFGEDNKAAAVASKAVALGKIAIDTGVAIANGTAQAMDLPFPANIAAVATTIATVISNIVTAKKSLESAKFAEGGIVAGTSYTGDRVQAMVNSGEMILNRDQQARLFEIANTPQGGQDYTALAQAVAQAVSQLPAPVMVYTEFEQFQKQTTTYRELAKI